MYIKRPQVHHTRLIECPPSNCDALLSSAGIGTHVAVFDDPHAWCFLSACLALQRWVEADRLWMPFKNLVLNLFLETIYDVIHIWWRELAWGAFAQGPDSSKAIHRSQRHSSIIQFNEHAFLWASSLPRWHIRTNYLMWQTRNRWLPPAPFRCGGRATDDWLIGWP